MPIDFSDSLRGEDRIDHWRYILVRLLHRPLGALDDPHAVRHQIPEFDLGPPAKPLLSRTIFHLEREAELVQPRVHRFMKNRRRDFCVREVWVDRERQLDQTRPLFMEVCAPAREARDDNVGEISLQMAEVVGHVTLDQRERSTEPRQYGGRVDVGTRVVHDYGNPVHVVPANAVRRALSGQQAQKLGEHDIKIVGESGGLFN